MREEVLKNPGAIVTTDVAGIDEVEPQGMGPVRSLSPSTSRSEQWTLFGRRTQQSKVVFFSQVTILYIIILTCLVNISVGSENFNLWSTLLASSIGYLLPSPKLKDRKNDQR